jgi:ATP-binding cassette subfamily B protein
MTVPLSRKRRFVVPEVVQTSAMDCGPAVLTCLLEGFGIPVHYGRLREACHTDVDGTSIDVLEQVACQFGLAAEQVMLPVDHLLLAEADALPAIVVVKLPNQFTHFVLAWRRHGPLVQIMDPSIGRRWLTGRRFLEEVYVHTHQVPASVWHEWALSDDFRRPLSRRLRNLGWATLGSAAEDLIDQAAAAPGWRPLARLDAAARLADSLVRAGGLKAGPEVHKLLRALLDEGDTEQMGDVPAGKALVIPEAFWSVRPAGRRSVEPNGLRDVEQVRVRGAVLIRVHGRRALGDGGQRPGPPEAPAHDAGPAPLSPELAAARAEPATRPWHTLRQLLRGHGVFAWFLLASVLTLVAGGSVLEAVLLRGLIDLGRDLGLIEQRLQAMGLILAFSAVLLLLEFRAVGGLVRLGRHLEGRLRMALFAKIPRLHDRYFQSRPTSDMAERSHALQQARLLPRQAGQFVRAALTLAFTGTAIAWVDPASAPLALLAAGLAIGLPLAFNPLLSEMDLRVRTHVGALSRFYLDALLGLAAVRAHGAERAVRREHEGLLVEWVRASRRLLRWVVVVEGFQIGVGFGLAGWLLLLHAGRLGDAGGALLLAYWALSLPVLGEEIALLARQYPIQRNILLRLLEPLGALEVDDKVTRWQGDKVTDEIGGPSPGPQTPGHLPKGVAVTFDAVTVQAAGQVILEDVRIHLEAGRQVAIVGASGAGKSSLVGLLLGWHRAAAGRVLIDGEPLDATRLDQLRRETAWVDPAVQLWNRSLAQNLLYGIRTAGERPMGEVLHQADLDGMLARLPDGLQTPLGEGGGLLSGGEGQRVRLGRALFRSGARLVILDEPFRGLDREKRRELLQRVRQAWAGATLLCITHDVGETQDFERVLVIERGRVVEDGPPGQLAGQSGSRYGALLEAEEAVRTGLWSSAAWQRLWLEGGRLLPESPRQGRDGA